MTAFVNTCRTFESTAVPTASHAGTAVTIYPWSSQRQQTFLQKIDCPKSQPAPETLAGIGIRRVPELSPVAGAPREEDPPKVQPAPGSPSWKRSVVSAEVR